jgi:hypothetical protein
MEVFLGKSDGLEHRRTEQQFAWFFVVLFSRLNFWDVFISGVQIVLMNKVD